MVMIPKRKTTGQATAEVDCLLPHHRRMLEEESGISGSMIAARGYRSITNATELYSYGFDAYQCQVPGLLVPLHHVDPRLTASGAARYQFRPDEPRVNGKGRSIRYETPAGSRQCVDISPVALAMLQNRDIPLIITEGAKKADAAITHGLCCVNLSGVWCWVQSGDHDDLPDSIALDDWNHIPLSGRRVEICFDSDIIVKPEVKQACSRLTQFLRSRKATVVIIYLPSGPNDEKTGLDDYFVRGGTVEQLRTLTRKPDATIRPDGIREELPNIRVTNQQLSGVVDESLDALKASNMPPQVFVQSGHLVRIVRSETISGEHVTIEHFSRDALTEYLSRVANFVNNTQQGQKSVPPPEWIAKSILAMAEYPGFPQIDGIVSSPVFSPEGTLCDVPGYNAASRLYYHAREPLSLPDTTPTTQNVANALSSSSRNSLSISPSLTRHPRRIHWRCCSCHSCGPW